MKGKRKSGTVPQPGASSRWDCPGISGRTNHPPMNAAGLSVENQTKEGTSNGKNGFTPNQSAPIVSITP